MKKKVAVILFNLGGPDCLNAVQPFLFNLFNDKAIINIIQPLRFLLARFISKRREKAAQSNYSLMGGKSPLLDWSEKQAKELNALLNTSTEDHFDTFVCMRYWNPRALEVATKIKDANYDEIIMLPLYPQFSTTTTGSSFDEWDKICKKLDFNAKTTKICCYPTQEKFIESHTNIIDELHKKALNHGPTRILFSAHGLPKKIIAKGDPYEHQIKLTVEAIIKKLSYNAVDYQICYQSKVGPMEWLTPSTEEAIEQASHENLGVLVVPIAFVSEHIETLVELDIEYRDFAKSLHIPHYLRTPALGLDKIFINSLADLCISREKQQKPLCLSSHKCCLRLRENLL